MNFEIVERIEARLAVLALNAPEMQDVHWVHSDEIDTDENYCAKCAGFVCAWYNGGEKPERANRMMVPDYSDSGALFETHGYANHYTEDDEPRWCDLCGVELAISLTCGDGEMSHWESCTPESPESWRILARLFNLYKPYLLERIPYSFQTEFEWRQGRKRAARMMLILRRLLQ